MACSRKGNRGSGNRPGSATPVSRNGSTAAAPPITNGKSDRHAQDPPLPMLCCRPLRAGKLAQGFGPSPVPPDIFLPTVRMRRAAEAQWKQTSPEVQAALQAYARGVNAFLHSHADSLPL